MNISLYLVALVLFIIGWVFAVINQGWRSPDLWVLSSIAIMVIFAGRL